MVVLTGNARVFTAGFDLKAGVANFSLTTVGNHNVAVAGPDIPEAVVLGDEAGSPVDGLTRSLELSPGTYTYFCSVPKHREAGMKGTFTVLPAAAAS